MAATTVNGFHPSRSLKPGVYAPIPAFFLPDTEDLDIPSLRLHVVRLAKAGVAPLMSGSMGEAIHLNHAERNTVIKEARSALDEAGLADIPIIAGTGAGSTRETKELCREAADAGADFSIVIPPGYFAGVLASNPKALKAFFTEVADESPIPVFIYNYPGASGGIDMDSDLISELAEHPNICGVKLTCGNVGKLTRIAATVADKSFYSRFPRKNPKAPFLVFGGFADFLTPSTFVNAHGAIAGLANVAPYTIVKLWELSVAALTDPAALGEANRLQAIAACGDFTIAKASIAGTKYLLEKLYGYGGLPRKPLPPIQSDAAEQLWAHPHVQGLVQIERVLSGKS
ncbi:dihydrodipicolinate synthetase [Vararia minispora EC-137]|uniref:Dihydrodipicolinate synthetase n=1 Tax=Vararia minispora EC-137 TaxID=1314806 RepID=A0ACB8QK59_9AGAM|nr:dihydrodipicolinate synthetase [Vararia minispora EC-137]